MNLPPYLRFFTSLKLTVTLLALGIVLVFWGTLAQVNLGLYSAQNEFFRSFFIYWQPGESGLRIPIFPGAYLVGGLLIINLFAAHFRYYQPGKKKYGIVLIHFGILLLIFGQFLTDILSVESTMSIRNGQSKNYSEADRNFELAVVDTSDPHKDKVVAIPGTMLRNGREITHADMPFTIRVKTFYSNSALKQKPDQGFKEVETTAGVGRGIWWRELPHETEMNRRDMPSGIVEIITPQGSVGTLLVSGFLSRPQELTLNGRTYQLDLRPERYYKPFSLHLIEFKFERYSGTDIPKNYQSRVIVENPSKGERREVDIYMNNPLRYWGETYYQSSFDPDEEGTVLQVVRNPGWLTPYFSCVLVSIGLLVQFFSHLIGFVRKRRTT